MKRIFFLLSLFALALSGQAQSLWMPDTVLNGRFEMRYVNQSADYAGPERCAIVRLLPTEISHEGVLYIHGFNDYFFQSEMAQEFVDHHYNFYAIDLRKYGRSLMPGQKRCQARDMKEYFADIDSALNIMVEQGSDSIVLMGHSTGGLIAAYYMATHHDSPIKALILNSPFLDWNLGKIEFMTGAVSNLGRLFPNMKISQGKSTAYGESLLKAYHGEWIYNTRWKSLQSPDVDAGWVRAVNSAQRYLRKHPDSIDVPVLLMYSSKSVNVDTWDESVNSADAVLDVKEIRECGMKLGKHVTPIEIYGGIHDLVLSAPKVRAGVYTNIFSWLQKIKDK